MLGFIDLVYHTTIFSHRLSIFIKIITVVLIGDIVLVTAHVL